MKKIHLYLIGGIFLLFGIYLLIFQQGSYFYGFFSMGLFLILLNIYNSISKEKLFHKWKTKQYLIFSILLILFCVIIDKIGVFLGYWIGSDTISFRRIIEYIFRWIIPFLYLMLTLLIGMEFFKIKLNKKISFILSLIIFVTLIGLFTEYLNHLVNSWIILKMPFTNYKIRGFFIIFQTLGYWVMAIIPLIIYKITNKTMKNKHFEKTRTKSKISYLLF